MALSNMSRSELEDEVRYLNQDNQRLKELERRLCGEIGNKDNEIRALKAEIESLKSNTANQSNGADSFEVSL